MKARLTALGFWALACFALPAWAGPATLQTRYARMQIDGQGFITSLVSLASGEDYSPAGHPSPLLSLHEYRQPYVRLLFPRAAAFDTAKQEVRLSYSNGATAVVKVDAKATYFRFQLVSLTPRGEVDNIVWGPLNTTIRGRIGDLLGVVRTEDWAIGMLGLDDNTIAGPPVEGDCYGMGYYIHSPDPKEYPVPPQYHEGQWFNIGGDGVNDVAFYSHPEEYFQQVFGTGAKLEPEFGSTVAYHARDRRRTYVHFWSLLPGFERSRPRHQVTDAVDADFLGSAVALYACPDHLGLRTLEGIILAEGLPHIVIDGRWVRDPASFHPQLLWSGPYDQCLDYAAALGFKDISRDTSEFYPCIGNQWLGGGVSFADGRKMSGQEFMAAAHRRGMTFGGLHTLTLFLQGGVSHDVTPVPSEHLQTVCRTKLARDISATETNIIVTDPAYLAEKGTWPLGDDSNYLRIGGEMLRYDGISQSAPWTLKGVKRGHASPAAAHQAGDELVKLQQNCYNGFVPDMTRLPDYADYYARLMVRNGMEAIGFDGLESTLYQSQGYYAVRVFFRRLFDTYSKLTGGKSPRVTGSCVFAGAWEYMDVCNVGGGNNMFDPVLNRWGIEGKDIRNGFANSYFPATFGGQSWHSDWSRYDAENLEAKSIGWDATYGLSVSQAAIEQTGEKDAILEAFHTWEDARAAGVFTAALKRQLKDFGFKFHLEQTGAKSFALHPVKETRISESANAQPTLVTLTNAYAAQPLQFALRFSDPVHGFAIALPDGGTLKSEQETAKGQYLICQGSRAYLADQFRRKTSDLPLAHPVILPQGETKLAIQFLGVEPPARKQFTLVTWTLGRGQVVMVGSPPGAVHDSSPTKAAAGAAAAGPDGLEGERVFGRRGDDTRSYQQTPRADFARGNFLAEVTVTLKGGGGAGCAFFGIGRGEADPRHYHKPAAEPVVYVRLSPSDFSNGHVVANVNGVESGQAQEPIGDGTHRVRLFWDAAGKRALFEVDGRSSLAVCAREVNFAGQDHLFIGGANGVRFADFSVKPLGDAEIKAAGFGEDFAGDPTAGTWLPMTPPTKELMRLLACWYDGSKLAATRTFSNGVARIATGGWTCEVNEERFTGEPGARDLSVTFKLADGVARSAAVSLSRNLLPAQAAPATPGSAFDIAPRVRANPDAD